MERIYLDGSAEVRQASLTMAQAAADMQQAAHQITESLQLFIERIEQIRDEEARDDE